MTLVSVSNAATDFNVSAVQLIDEHFVLNAPELRNCDGLRIISSVTASDVAEGETHFYFHILGNAYLYGAFSYFTAMIAPVLHFVSRSSWMLED